MKKFIKKIGLSLLTTAAALWWTTCEVGLGEAVDTMAPTVSVSNPIASSICAGPVTISGTCGDDKGISSINIVLTNTNTGAKFNYSGKVQNGVSWSTTINEVIQNSGYPLRDGQYTADVTAVDIFGRVSGTSSTAFDVDNTPPVFCVTSPNSLLMTNPRKYGRSVTVSGEIADDHEIEKMTIRVFKTDASGNNPVEITSQLAKTEFRDFETAGGTTVYVAKYFESAPSAYNNDGSENPDLKLYKNYLAFFGIDPNTTSLTAAQRNILTQDTYITIFPTITDKAGNTSDRCYISSSIKELAARSCGVDVTIDSLQTAQLMKIYNGTYNLTELNDEQKGKILSLMNGTYALETGDVPYYCQYVNDDATKQSPLAASVNSNNSPTYEFNGYENPTTSADGWVGVNTGGTITITLKAGLDGWGILPSSLEVNLYECDDNGTKTTGAIAFSSNPFKDPTSVATVLIKDATNTETQNIATSVTNQSYYVTLPSLKAGKKYILETEGKDENDSELLPAGGNWYGFKVASAITPPSFSCSDLLYMNGNALSAGDGYKLRLNIKDESDKIQTNGIKITGYLYNKHIPGKSYIKNYAPVPTGVVKEYKDAIQEDTTANFYYIDLPLKDFNFSANSGNNYSIVIEAQGYYLDENSNKVLSSPATYMVWVDATAPAITIVSPKVGETLITESFASYESSGEGAQKTTSITPTGNWSDFDGSSTHRMWYTVDDDATPRLSWQAASGTYVRGTNYYERQVVGQDCYALLDTDNFVAGETSVNGYYTLSLAPSADGKTWTEINGVSQLASQTTWEQKINVVEGSGKIFRVVGVDTVGNLSDVVQRTDLKYDFEKPKIRLDSEPASNGYYNAANATGGKLTVEFTATDSYKIDKANVTVEATKNGAAAASGTSGYTCKIEQAKDASNNDDPKAVKVTITLTSGGTSDGEWKWIVSASDAAGRAAQSYELSRIVDTVAPTFEVFADTEPAAIKGKKIVVGSGEKSTWTDWNGAWYSSSGLVFNGNFKEETSGLAKISYELKPAGAVQELNGEKTRAGEKGSLVPFSLTVTSFEQSVRSDTGSLTSNILNISVTDKAGNVSGKEILTIDIDQSQPLFAAAWYTYVASPAASDLAAAEGTLVSDGTKDMTVYGTVSSPLSGVAGLDWQITPAAGGAAADPAPTIKYTAAALTDAASYVNATWEDLGSGAVADKSKVTGWKAVIAAAKLAAGDVYVTAKNVAEKAVKTQIFTIDKDIVAPTINMNTPDTMIASYNATAAGSSDTTPPTVKPDGSPVPTTSASVNGTVKIAGNSGDEKELSATEVYWSLDGTATIDESRDHKIDDIGTSIYNWNVAQYEFSKLNSENTKFLFADGTEYIGNTQTVYIKVAATDKAHNKTISVYKYTVDPDSDRPKITFSAPDDLSAMSSGAYVLKKGSALLRGKVEDDDGLTGLKLWYNDNDEADASSADGLKWTELGLTSGVFEIFGDTSEHDGQHKLKFKVEDAKGTPFVTGDGSGTNNTWLRPKIHKAGTGASETFFGESASDDCFVYIAIDTKKPAIENKSYFVGDSASASVESSSKPLGLLGGKKDKFTLYFYAKDESGLDEENISFVFNGVTYKKTPAAGQKPLTITPSEAPAYPATTDPAYPGWSLITVKDISVAGLPSGSNYVGTIKVTDNAGLENTGTIPVEVDNDAPELTIINPSQSSSQTVSGSVNAYGTVSGADSETKLYYALTFEDDNHDTAAATTEPAASAFTEIKQKSKLMWYVYFDGGVSTEEETHADTLNTFLIKSNAIINGWYAREETIADGRFTKAGGVVIYLWARAEDAVGNVKTEHYKVLLDPQGDKPEVSFSYPAANGDTMGGEIKIYGGARSKDKTNPTIKAVFAQIITNSHEYKDASYTPPASGWGILSYDPDAKKINEFTLKANDWTYLQAAGYPVYKMEGYPVTQTPWTSSNTDEDADKYGIPITPNGSSWSIKLNAKDELNPKAAEAGQEATTNLAAIRIQSYDGVHFSSTESRAFIVDSDTPQLRDLMLEQFGLDGTDDFATASREYVEDMYVTGRWFLTFTLNDGQAIGVVKIGKGNTAAAAESAKFTYLGTDGGVAKDYTDPTKSGTNYRVVTRDTAISDYKKLNVKYPLDTASDCGTQYVYVYYEDSSGKGGDQAAKTYKISYDNKAPTLAVEADEKYSFPETVQQSDGWYTIQSKVSEPKQGVTDQSGFERVAFYFTRGTGINEEIFDPMIKKGATGNRISTSGLTNKYGLYWKQQINVGRDADNLNILTITADPNIHTGGLAEIDGAVYRIMSIDGSKVTINGQPRKEVTVALFAVANVVDNTIQESSYGDRRVTDYGFGYDSPSNDDDDLMVESVVNDNTDWTWSANIYSKNIADGAVNIHYVAFDKAGNWAQAGGVNSERTTVSDPPVVAATVANNRPRVANLYVGTDLNGNNAIDGSYNGATAGERDEWSAPYKASSLTWNQDTNKGTAVTDAVLGTATNAYLTAKGMTVIKPEILGGNGEIRYAYNISKRDGTTADGKTKYTTIIEGHNDTAFITEAQTIANPMANESARLADITIQAGDWTTDTLRTGGIPDTGTESPHKVEFTFYDQTEGAPAYGATGFDTRSDLASATIYMAVSMADGEEPKATREDLFWNGKGAVDDEDKPKNSVAWNGDTPLGHIDLSADLPDTFKATGATDYTNTKDGTTYPAAEMDRDSKASGKIVLRGKVSDNKMLYHIYLNIPAMSTNFEAAKTADANFGYNATYGYMAATYNASAGTWTTPVATDARLSSYGIKFTVTNSKVKASGHTADWEFVWDTSYINNVAAADVTVDVYASDQVLTSAVDAGGAYTSLNGTAKYTAPAPQEKNVSGSTAATAGNKPATLQIDVVPYITGLTTMLSDNGVEYTRTAKGHWPVYERDGTDEKFVVNGFNFDKGNGALVDQSMTESGWLVVERGETNKEVQSLNNINNNDAKLSGTDYDNAYNRQPNGKNNNRLTDDVYVDVWQLAPSAASLGDQEIDTPIMKIKPGDAGLIGFAFKYGKADNHFAMPGKETSYERRHKGQDTKNSLSMAFDANGNSFATIADADSSDNYADFFTFHSSLWPNPGDGVINNAARAAQLEMTGQKGKKGETSPQTLYTGETTKHQSPCIATAGSNVYLAYYDAFNKEIRFRSSLSKPFKVKDNGDRDGDTGNFVDLGKAKERVDNHTYAVSVANCQIVAEENSSGSPQGGSYVSIAAISGASSKVIPSTTTNDDVVVMVWYDSQANAMWYSYNDTPSASRVGTGQTVGAGWKTPVKLFGNKANGYYCKVAVDAKKGVHIAAQDSSSGSLWYAYLANYADAWDQNKTVTVCRVDTESVGKNIDLDVALASAGGDPVPYISYYAYADKLPKFARLCKAGVLGDGVDAEGKYTETWDVGFVPTTSSVPQDNINVGVWKNAGVINNSTATASDANHCYGNGTKNAVLGYKRVDAGRGYVETAQLTGDPTAAY